MFFRFSGVAVVAATVLLLPGFAGAAPKLKPAKVTQAQVALKSAFPVVKATDPSVRSALPATNLAKARTKLNKPAMFSGVVTQVYAPKNGKRVLVDFAPDYKKAVIGLVDARSFKLFPDLRTLKGKRVLLSGRVIAYKEQVQVDLSSPSAIRIVK